MPCNCEEQCVEVVGILTKEETGEIENLFNRQMCLRSLQLTLEDQQQQGERPDPVICDLLQKDLADVEAKLQNWWRQSAEKYRWKGTTNGRWQIDFATSQILLIAQAECTGVAK